MPVEGDRGTGQFHRECACDVLMDRAMMKGDSAVRNAVDELVGAMMINVEMLCLDGKRESLTQSRRRRGCGWCNDTQSRMYLLSRLARENINDDNN